MVHNVKAPLPYSTFKIVKVTPSIAKYSYEENFIRTLQEKETNREIYYEWEPKYPALIAEEFVSLGYVVKMKELKIGHFFIVKKNRIDGQPLMINMENGKREVEYDKSIWTCIDIAIESMYSSLSLILENDKKQEIPFAIDRLQPDEGSIIIEMPTKDYLEKKFGDEMASLIVQSKVKIGMTKDMCILSWGTKSINTTIVSGNNTEQWIYSSGSYLYFTNGLLSGIQN